MNTTATRALLQWSTFQPIEFPLLVSLSANFSKSRFDPSSSRIQILATDRTEVKTQDIKFNRRQSVIGVSGSVGASLGMLTANIGAHEVEVGANYRLSGEIMWRGGRWGGIAITWVYL